MTIEPGSICEGPDCDQPAVRWIDLGDGSGLTRGCWAHVKQAARGGPLRPLRRVAPDLETRLFDKALELAEFDAEGDDEEFTRARRAMVGLAIQLGAAFLRRRGWRPPGSQDLPAADRKVVDAAPAAAH